MKTSFVRSFFVNIILPTLLTILLFIIAIFFIIIPSSRKNLLDRKREMIRELTNSTWNLLDSYHQKVSAGELTLAEAQQEAISNISSLRYGDENKDYFWITDMQPRMIVHPYRSDLDGEDLSDFTDSHGKKLFVEFVKTVKSNGAGYVDYYWQWKDDSLRIVPKLSYVREFAPWQWVIGTGIYIEDVRHEIGRITRRLINISVAIIFMLALILFYIARQTFQIEQKKQLAEKELADSREKYKSLVEASTEGTLMIMDFKIIYANQIIQNILGFSEKELTRLNLNDLFDTENIKNTNFIEILQSDALPDQIEVNLLHKNKTKINALISISQIQLFGKNGFILIIKDVGGLKKIREELGESKLKFQMLTDNINIGVFRIQVEKNPKFIEVNQAAQKIFGMDNTVFENFTITDFFRDKDEAQNFMDHLLNEGSANKRIIQLKRQNGTNSIVSISAIVIKSDDKKEIFIDGIIEDISEQKKSEQAREEIIIELQTSLVYLNQPVKHFAQKCLCIPMNTPIKTAAKNLKQQNQNAALIVTDSGETIGIITAEDLWKRVMCDEKTLSHPVYEIMTAPVISLSENALVFEALILMQERFIRHLPLADVHGNINKIISDKEIIQLSQYSAGLLVHEINRAESIEEIITRCKTLPQMVKYLVESGFLAPNVTRIISSIGDSVANKFLKFALQEMGEPPVRFAFMVLGSQGREEQTLVTDQDNVLIYEDTEKNVQNYFLKLAEIVNGLLDQAGYRFCNGDVMAKNPKWCVSLSEWKKHFHHWINEAEPQDLVDINIFFDFRHLYGDLTLVQDLNLYVQQIAQDKAAFFNHLAKNSLLVKPPITFTGSIKKSSGEHQQAFDIKFALMPVVDFARIYTLRHQISERNTLQRLEKLYEKNIITKSLHDEMVECYNYLMMLRFQHQVQDLEENKIPDNFINPKRLTQIEQHMLKKIFSQISGFQKKLSYDFTGIA